MRSACLTGRGTGCAAHAVDWSETADTSVSAGEGPLGVCFGMKERS
jgi:hypothetical protein